MKTNDKNNLINTTEAPVIMYNFGNSTHKKVANKSSDSIIRLKNTDRLNKLLSLINNKKTLENTTSVMYTALQTNRVKYVEPIVENYIKNKNFITRSEVENYIKNKNFITRSEAEKATATVLITGAQLFIDAMKNAYKITETDISAEPVKVSKPSVSAEPVTSDFINSYVAKKVQNGVYKEIIISEDTKKQMLT